MSDGKDSYLLDISDHRVKIGDWHYWVIRINPADAEARGIKHHDIVEAHNDRGSVLLAAMVTGRVPAGTVHSYESSAIYDPIGKIGDSPDRGGCINILTSKRPIIKKSHSAAWNSCLIEIRKWQGEA